MREALPNSNSFVLLAILAMFLLTNVGCEGDTIISPYSGRDIHYSVYGFINTTDTHYVRIVPIRANGLRDITPQDLDVIVSTVELRTNRTDVWEPVLHQLDDGSRGLPLADSTFGHVYRAIFTPNADDEFLFEVRGFDGRIVDCDN